MNNQEISKKIVQLLDGELGSDDASSLYSEIASDSSLQDEMQNHIVVKNMVNKGLSSPPDFLKAGILKSTGLATPFYSKLIYVVPVLIAFGLGFFASNFFDETKPIDNLNQEIEYTKASLDLIAPAEFSQINGNKSEAKINSKDISDIKFIASNSNVSLTKEKLSEQSGINELGQNDINENETQIKLVDNLHTYYKVSETTVNKNIGFNSSNINPTEYAKDFSFVNPKEFTNFSVDLRGLNLNDFHESRLQNTSNGINNFAVALYYNFTKNLKLGLEGGQENFIQKFNFNDGEFTSAFEQNYTANFFGVSAKFSERFINNLPNLEFYSRAFLGGMRTGPLGRLETGISYNLSNRYTAFIGYELAHTSYFYRENIFHSTKSGLSYGISLKL